MRTFIIVITLLLIAGLGYLTYAHFSGGSVPTFGLPIGGEKAKVRARTLAFFEHLKFKNRNALKDFVSPSISEDEISLYLSKTLGINADNIDIGTLSLPQIELDSNEQRARARVNINGQDLGSNKPFSLSKIIFLYKSEGDWLIDTKNL